MQNNTNLYPSTQELEDQILHDISATKLVKTSMAHRLLPYIFSFIITAFILSLIYLPWYQTVKGSGRVIAFSPNERMQSIAAPVDGRIEKWHVMEGTAIKKGDRLVDISDLDPDIIARLGKEKDAVQLKFDASDKAAKTSYNNVLRQKDLFNKGLSSKRAYELAELEYAKLLSEVSSTAAELARLETRFARQASQEVLSPVDGILQNVVTPQGGSIVKIGQQLAMIVPETDNFAVELYVSGIDQPLLNIGDHVRLQFEGWPAIQFSGWPSVAVGTFGGVISVIDSSDDGTGKFRIIVKSKNRNDWPDSLYLKQGTRAVGWVLLNSVSLGWELWRKFNDFPVSVKKVETKNNAQK